MRARYHARDRRCASIDSRERAIPHWKEAEAQMSFIVRLLVNAAALWVATEIVPGVRFQGEWLAFFGVAFTFGVLNAVVRPVAWVLTFPLIIVTLGLFLFVVNGLMLWLTSSLSEGLGLGFRVSGFWAAFWGALVVSLVSTILSMLVADSARNQ
jgi:putative membrane protein